MEENGLRALNNLHPLRHLKCLHLGMNRIVEVAELEKLAAHSELIEITLGNSPVARKQAYRPMLVKKIPTLRVIDGREVTAEERDHVELLFAPSEVSHRVPREIPPLRAFTQCAAASTDTLDKVAGWTLPLAGERGSETSYNSSTGVW